MVNAPRLEQRQTQALVLTPQLRQAIALLQLSNLELSAAIAEEVERNPLLDIIEPEEPAGQGVTVDGPDASVARALGFERKQEPRPRHGPRGDPTSPSAATTGTKPAAPAPPSALGDVATAGAIVTLREHMMRQLDATAFDPADAIVGAYLIGNMDAAGYLRSTIEEVAAEFDCDRARVGDVLSRLQQFDPPGVMARDLAECLSLQLLERGRLDPAMKRLLEHLELLANGDQRALMRVCQVDAEDLDDMVAEIRSLDPKPGLSFEFEPAPSIVPDVVVTPTPDGAWRVELNAGTLPRLAVNSAYRTTVTGRGERRDEAYLSTCFTSANWLVKSLHQRAQTVLATAGEIVSRQQGFLTAGVAHLRPLTLREVAAALGVHESTVSRATRNKYIETPRGIFDMRFFFSSAIACIDRRDPISSTTVRHRIRELVASEDPARALSDQRIVGILRSEGIDIARRTIAKYRENMGIGSSAARRKANRMRARP